MEVAEFKRILDIGLGRAILHLQTHDTTPYREAILHACLHNTAYDRQVEGTRAEYMHDIVRLTGDQAFYREQVLSALTTDDYDDFDTQHQLVFASILGSEGDERARQVVYEIILHHLDDSLLGSVLINLDGLRGFTLIMDRLAETQTDANNLDIEYLISVLEDKDGKKATQRRLKQYIAHNPQVASLIQAGLDQREHLKQVRRKRSNPATFSYKDVKTWMDNPDILLTPPVSWVVWGQHASEEDIDQAAEDFLQVDDADIERIFAYMQIFRDRWFSLEPDRLIE